MRVLLMEPDTDFGEVASAALDAAGYGTVVVANAEDGLGLLDAIDAVVSEIGPGTWRLLASARGLGLPAAIHSVQAGDQALLDRGRSAGVEIAEKTGDLDVLVSLVREMSRVPARH